MSMEYLSICSYLLQFLSTICLIVFSLTFSVKFILRYFILLDIAVNRIMFLISFSDCSFLVHRNIIDLCVGLVPCKFIELFFKI